MSLNKRSQKQQDKQQDQQDSEQRRKQDLADKLLAVSANQGANKDEEEGISETSQSERGQ